MKYLVFFLLTGNAWAALPPAVIVSMGSAVSWSYEAQEISGLKVCIVTVIRSGRVESQQGWPRRFCQNRWNALRGVLARINNPAARKPGSCGQPLAVETFSGPKSKARVKTEHFCMDLAGRAAGADFTKWWKSATPARQPQSKARAKKS